MLSKQYENKALDILNRKKLLTRMQWYNLFCKEYKISWHYFKFRIVQKLVASNKICRVKEYYYLKGNNDLWKK